MRHPTFPILLTLSSITLSTMGADMVSFDAGQVRLSLDATGRIAGLFGTAAAKEYLPPERSAYLLYLVVDGKHLSPTALSVSPTNDRLRLVYGQTGVSVTVKAATRPTHVTFELVSVEGAQPSMIRWGHFATTIGKTVGATVGVVRDNRFAIGIQALSIQTIAGAARKEYGSLLYAYAKEHDGGVLGSKIALFGCPADQALDTIGEIEVAEGLPHPMLDGVWAKRSPTAHWPYMIVAFSEATMEEVLELAQQGGFRYVYHPGPFKTWGHFQLKPDQFPHGDESLKRCADQAAKLGIRLGLHTLTAFITTNDPYVTPVPDPRLARWGATTLSAAIDQNVREIPVSDPQAISAKQRRGWSQPVAMVGQEIMLYQGLSDAKPWRLLDCDRGAFGTRAASHEAGAEVARLATHPYKTLFPGITNGMMDEMTQRLVELMNYTGLRMMSFDGIEGLWSYGHGSWAGVRFVKQCFDGWQPEVVSGASCLLHYNWHIHTRMNWGELTQSAKIDIDEYRSKRCQYYDENLLPKGMGWWRLGLSTYDWEATRMEDVEYLLAKAAGHDATHAMQTHPPSLRQHGYADVCLALVKAWTQVREQTAFSADQLERLREKGRDFHLEAVGNQRWQLTEIEYSPFHWLCSGTGRPQPHDPARQVLSFTTESEAHFGTTCRFTNPWHRQPLRFELRALGSFDYEDGYNTDLMPASAGALKWERDLHEDAPRLTVADAEVHGLKGYEISTQYAGKEKPSWVTRVIADFPKHLNLRKHRGLGLWVRGDGKGELLFVELVARNCKRQYYVPVDFTGERYFEFPLGEMCLGRYYAYDWNHWSGFASWWVTMKGFDYGHVERISMGFNAIPPGQEVRCSIAGVKALKEFGTNLRHPSLALNGRQMSFDTTVAPGCYLIYEGRDVAELRDANYRLLREVAVAGQRLQAEPGQNQAQVSYDGDAGPAPWSRWELRCCGKPEEVSAR